MIRFIPHNDIDFDKWDDCVANAINGLIYPYSFYLNQVAAGWHALVQNDYEAVMPLPCRRKMGFDYIFQPHFVQQLGVFSAAPPSDSMVRDFVRAIPSRFRFVNYNLNTYNQLKALPREHLTSRVTYELDMIQPYSQIQQNYSSQTHRNLKKAIKEKVFVTPNSEPIPIIESFRQYRGARLSGMTDAHYHMLKHLIYSGLHRGDTQVYSAYTAQNSFCAGVVFFRSHHKSILIFSGSTPEARKNGAMTAIVDQYIQDHAQQNLTLDFEGSNEKNLARFYRGFGSKECVFLQLRINNFPFFLRPFAGLYFHYTKKRAQG